MGLRLEIYSRPYGYLLHQLGLPGFHNLEQPAVGQPIQDVLPDHIIVQTQQAFGGRLNTLIMPFSSTDMIMLWVESIIASNWLEIFCKN